MVKDAIVVTAAVLRIFSHPLFYSSMCRMPHVGNSHTAEP